MRRRSTQQIAPPVEPVKKPEAKKKVTKFIVNGYKFSSKKEVNRYKELNGLVKAGEISDLSIKPRYELVVNNNLICRYVADFSYLMEDKNYPGVYAEIVEDVKSRKSGGSFDIFRIKAKLMKAIHGIDVVVI